ncbi:iron-containing alcohol dehydrogenase [Bariatricus massiliensis]|uniref:Iron-containing alcohol dehydrogenase n=1 Tax=Bariatricus massiliensis TaxID=1745713 RepID=A0ABS8DIS6_9FIRM|nr:iron-containing alcohol dehydrogenase [Bariatricus massiliensis]MCB7305142.1 iron-containing alcohol dehydrogenase [Bariatricus massiliensis]MCB7375750.1 iron-containing alcohol dehydrogenase [Bariatricus massiliensis]MCB7388285.1 iron-containing alcohol dehydrogenase [Bariatricus massiliensis]MCB7412512.1 iron-containing alcohol dehydrogenase [Bariatricus massiliensis]MCQ5254094.1 iron-containing alcohol dehydrogenase [Bariatricus massiliensis]
MQNFVQYAPTEIVFGKDTELKTGQEVKKWGGHRTLIVFGGGSAVRSGLIDRVENSLTEAGIVSERLGGVQPNPRLSFARQGVAKAVEMEADFILAVGGGSAIDTAKAIAHGAANPEFDLWDIWTQKVPLTKSFPVGCVLTIAAAGSETSDSAVLTNEELGRKSGIGTELNRPRFAVMNPELTYTLPKYQLGCGIVDIMMHTLERYFIPNQKNQMTDEIAEGLLRVVIENGRKAMENPSDYDAMSEIMWCGSLSHNNLTGLGREKDFSVHKLGHALSAKYDAAHGATLSAVWGAWAEYVCESDYARFAHFGEKVWGIRAEDEKEAAKLAIGRTVAYFREIGMPVGLKELGIGEISEKELRELSMNATMGGTVKLSKIKELGVDDVYQIFQEANN